jgi:hypothetical protein
MTIHPIKKILIIDANLLPLNKSSITFKTTIPTININSDAIINIGVKKS